MQISVDTPTQPDELLAFSVLNDTPRWLSHAAQELLTRDPVKAANEAEAFAEILRKRADRVLAHAVGKVFLQRN